MKALTFKSSEEIEKEAEKYVINTFADLLRALREHPDWVAELRRLFLTTEFLEIPRKIEEILETLKSLDKRVSTLEEDVAILKEDVAVLKEDVAILKEDMAVLKGDVAVLKGEVVVLKSDVNHLKGEFGRFKGREYERKVKEKYYAILGRILKGSRILSFEEILPILEQAEEEGSISAEEFEDVLRLDLLIEGKIKATLKPVILGIEISYRLYEEDLERSLKRALILGKILKKEVIPTVVGAEISEGLKEKAEEVGVLVIHSEW
ncbi:MAG: hypothetical protein NZ850_07480 [Caldimicrobium sp.]|nr:hypothetical protein [Caldimicrobium sp.]